MDENIKYELAEAEKLEVIDNAGVAENEKKSIVTVLPNHIYKTHFSRNVLYKSYILRAL